MQYNQSDFDSREFRELLDSYEDMLRNGGTCYFDSSDIYDIADYYRRYDREQDALDAIDFGLSMHHDAQDIMALKGSILFRLDRMDEAHAVASSLTDFSDCDVLMFLAELSLADGDPESADRYLRRAVSSCAEDEDLAVDAVTLFIDYVQYDYARKWLEKISGRFPGSVQIKELQAELHLVGQEYIEAEKLYNELLDTDPYSLYYWEQLALTEYNMEEWGKALDCFDFIEAIDSSYQTVNMVKVECLIETEQYDKAERIIRDSIKRDGETYESLYLLGNTLGLRHRYEESLIYLKKAIDMNPDDRQIYIVLGDAQLECGMLHEAVESYKTAFEAGFPTSPDNIKILLLQLFKADDKEAIRDILTALYNIQDLNQDEYSDFLPILVYCQYELGDEEGYRDSYRKTLEHGYSSVTNLFGLPDPYTAGCEGGNMSGYADSQQ